MQQTLKDSHQLIPDLCRLPLVLGVLAVTQLLVIIHVLSLAPLAHFNWELLSLLSIYAQWLSMLSLACLCNLRGAINRLALPLAASTSFAIILVVAVVTNSLAQWIYQGRSWTGWSAQWLLRDLIIIAVIGGIALRYLYVQQQWLREQKATHSARLDALHARIRPHFLFNSLNTVASLVRHAPQQAEEAVEDLAALMRANLSSRHLLNEWQQELDICRAYQRIEQLRLGERLQVDWQVEQVPNDMLVPPLVLQPLLENAIYHGIEKQPEGGVVSVTAKVDDKRVMLEIKNPVLGSEPRENSTNGRHNGVALDNIRARLASLFRDPKSGHDMSSLELQRSATEFIARVSMPVMHSAALDN